MIIRFTTSVGPNRRPLHSDRTARRRLPIKAILPEKVEKEPEAEQLIEAELSLVPKRRSSIVQFRPLRSF